MEKEPTDFRAFTVSSVPFCRKYVQLDEQTRQMKPSELGLALCHAYMLIDPESLGPEDE